MKAKWLDRSLITGPYLTLCTTEAQFRTALRHLGIKEKISFLMSKHANATVHLLNNPAGAAACIVCLGPTKELTGPQIASTLVHEAVHIWQEFRERIGESDPSSEFEAYSIQTIAQRLMEEYARQVH